MQIHIRSFTVHKRFALTISRGTSSESTNLWLVLQHEGIEGWGEASPFSVRQTQTSAGLTAALQAIAPQLAPFSPFDQQALEPLLLQLPSAARAALDLALHDWRGKRLGLPLWKLWGLARDRIAPTSVTIGINSPAAAQKRLLDWQEFTVVRAVKIKLGSPAGLAADREMFSAVLEAVPTAAKVSVDANGGWDEAGAIAMSHWLAERGVTYLEQPLAAGQEAGLPALYRESPLPIFVDESCFISQDIPALADRVHGINIKLMKSGGLTEAMRLVHTARAHGLGVMLGCYSDSAIANTAAAHLSPLADHLDLDSHLNLRDDPFVGANLQDGCLLPNDRPGLGVIERIANRP